MFEIAGQFENLLRFRSTRSKGLFPSRSPSAAHFPLNPTSVEAHACHSLTSGPPPPLPPLPLLIFHPLHEKLDTRSMSMLVMKHCVILNTSGAPGSAGGWWG